MARHKIVIVLIPIVILLASLNGHAGKPFRKPVKDLAHRADIIMLGRVVSLHPSLLKNSQGHPQAVAEVDVFEILKGDNSWIHDNKVYVMTNYQDHTMFDENGKIISLTTEWRYWMQPDSQKYLLFLKGEKEKGAFQVYRPLDKGSGVVEITNDRNGIGNEYLVELRRVLNEKDNQ